MSSYIPPMYRLARPRQALRLESVVRVRSYSTAPPEAQGQTEQPKSSDGAPRTQRKPKRAPVKLDTGAAYTARVNSKEDSLAGTLLRETKAGHAAQAMSDRIGEMAAKRRAQRLETEVKRAQEAPRRPPQAQPATLSTNEGNASSAPVRDRTSHFRQNRGQQQVRRDGASGGRPDNRNNRNFKSRTRGPPPRVSTINFAPKRTAQTEDDSADLTAADLNANVEEANYPGPWAVSPDLRNVFRKPASSKLDIALSNVSSTSPSSLKAANRILRRFAGDYSASAPKPSQALYTTPIEKLPLRTQLELAMAKSKDLGIPSRQYLSGVVSKAVGEVPAGTVV